MTPRISHAAITRRMTPRISHAAITRRMTPRFGARCDFFTPSDFAAQRDLAAQSGFTV